VISQVFFIVLLGFFAASTEGKEVDLVCAGQEEAGDTKAPPQNRKVTIEVTFDEQAKKVLKFTQRLGPGCFEADQTTDVKCECKVTNSEISCASEKLSGKNKNWKDIGRFSINRRSGRMTSHRSSGDGESYFYYNAELTCEKHEGNKF
jgi:hypothetical protein